MTFLYALATLWPKTKHSIPITCMLSLSIFFVSMFSSVQAQSPQNREAANGCGIEPLLVGQKVPNDFWTKEHLFYVDGDTVRKSLNEHRGKLLILDFWSTYCGICLHHMKHNHAFLASYYESVALIPVNPRATKDGYKAIANTHNKVLRRPEAESFLSIYSDGFISTLFPVYAYPTYIWISPTGNVLAMTTSVSEGYVKQIIEIHKTSKNEKS